jgi:hypothetical protein
MPQLGDENMQAASVEEAIIAPQFNQYVLCVHHLILVGTR